MQYPWPWVGFIFGSLIGSFLNVCIYRLPLGLNFITPGSRCGACHTPLKAYDNLPILGYLRLMGSCRFCGYTYGSRYFWNEILVGAIAAMLVWKYQLQWQTWYFFTLACILLVITWIDIDHQLIPDSLSIGPWLIGLALAGIFTLRQMGWFVSFQEAVLASLLGAGFLWVLAFVYELITGIEGLGMGDVKLMGFFGAHFGYEAVMVSIFVGSFAGALIGVLWIAIKGKNKRTPIPFGPFLCLGLVVYILGLHQGAVQWLFGALS
jgi:leader peptidase (prepilin peptidase)/N-methyltransferase